MTTLKLSIITVVFNNETTIIDTVQSVAMQTYPNVEYLVIDGQSTDGTISRLGQFENTVTRLVSEPDRGIYDAMNKGIGLATGDVIGFVNADDFYASDDVFAKVTDQFRHPGVDACYGNLCYVHPVNTASVVRYWRSTNFRPGSFSLAWCPPHPTFFVRRSVYEKFGGFDLSYKIAADIELMMRFMEVHKIRVEYIPEVLVKMRMGGTTNKSLKNIAIQNGEILRALKQHGLSANPVRFFMHKISSRGQQFFVRPEGGTET